MARDGQQLSFGIGNFQRQFHTLANANPDTHRRQRISEQFGKRT